MTKLIAKLLLLVIILSSLFTIAGCTLKFAPKWRRLNTSFMVTIEGVKQQTVIDFEITDKFYICVSLFGIDDAETVKDNIQFEYDEGNTLLSYAYTSGNKVFYHVYFYEIGHNNEFIITYNGKTMTIGYNILDYNFEKNGWMKLNSINDLDRYPEFKEMLTSLKYHEFQAPYVGLENYENYPHFDNKFFWHYNLSDKNDTSYLEYLTDSIYYPSSFEWIDEYSIVALHAVMEFTGLEKVQKGVDRSIMDCFEVWYDFNYLDYKNPESDLYLLTFSARNKEELYSYEGKYPSFEAILLEKYPEEFFQYQMDDITIYILSSEKIGARAYFIHDNYFYEIYSHYYLD